MSSGFDNVDNHKVLPWVKNRCGTGVALCWVKAEAKRAEGKSENPEAKSERKAWTRRANEKPGSEERELRTEDLSGGPFKKQIIDKKQVEIPREAQAEQRMRKIEIRRFLLCC